MSPRHRSRRSWSSRGAAVDAGCADPPAWRHAPQVLVAQAWIGRSGPPGLGAACALPRRRPHAGSRSGPAWRLGAARADRAHGAPAKWRPVEPAHTAGIAPTRRRQLAAVSEASRPGGIAAHAASTRRSSSGCPSLGRSRRSWSLAAVVSACPCSGSVAWGSRDGSGGGAGVGESSAGSQGSRDGSGTVSEEIRVREGVAWPEARARAWPPGSRPPRWHGRGHPAPRRCASRSGRGRWTHEVTPGSSPSRRVERGCRRSSSLVHVMRARRIVAASVARTIGPSEPDRTAWCKAQPIEQRGRALVETDLRPARRSAGAASASSRGRELARQRRADRFGHRRDDDAVAGRRSSPAWRSAAGVEGWRLDRGRERRLVPRCAAGGAQGRRVGSKAFRRCSQNLALRPSGVEFERHRATRRATATMTAPRRGSGRRHRHGRTGSATTARRATGHRCRRAVRRRAEGAAPAGPSRFQVRASPRSGAIVRRQRAAARPRQLAAQPVASQCIHRRAADSSAASDRHVLELLRRRRSGGSSAS